ncbi:MAG: hypothetical protein LLF95_03415, partial [Bacteroidales bacterium]|nr:hypothetical protein [Bacteroidales bacterium]
HNMVLLNPFRALFLSAILFRRFYRRLLATLTVGSDLVPACRRQAFRRSFNKNRNCGAKKIDIYIQKPCIYT